MTQSFKEFHTHIYFDQDTKVHAEELYSRIGHAQEIVGVTTGRFHTRCVGPHPTWMFTMEYSKETFEQVMFWLMSNLDGLSALVHPLSGDDVEDHTKYALWFGRQLQLNLLKL